MTILSRVVTPDYELTVCGTPSKAWFDWLVTTKAPLTADQIAWRDLHLRNLDKLSTPQPTPQPTPRRSKPYDLVDTEEL